MRAWNEGSRCWRSPRKQLATKAAKRHAPAAHAAAMPKECATATPSSSALAGTWRHQATAKELFPYGKKAIVDAPKNKASIENIVSGATRLTFTPSGMAR